MKIRELKQADAEYMLEWMKDDFVVHDLATDFSKKTIDDCRDFIDYAAGQYRDLNTCRDIHLAITDDNDEYMGTVSLKDINRDSHSAEFAITIRAAAMGKGYGRFAMDYILDYGFEHHELCTNRIFWCVDERNLRAVRFYDKQGYKKIVPTKQMQAPYKDIISAGAVLIWYEVEKDESLF